MFPQPFSFSQTSTRVSKTLWKHGRCVPFPIKWNPGRNHSDVFVVVLVVIPLLQLDKIVKEKEAQFNEEKNKMWKELTDAFQKVCFSVVRR